MVTFSEAAGKVEIGVAGTNTYTGLIRADEFLQDLKGKKAIQKYREMRDNNAIVGAVMYAVEQTLRDVCIEVEPADKSDAAKKEAEFLESILDDMEHSLDDHIAEALSSLTYGFSFFETVYKKRMGSSDNPKKRSKFTDGRIGIRKLAIRAPWTIERFEVDKDSSDVLGVYQQNVWGKGSTFIPTTKAVYYRTTSLNNDPSGRSVLRNAYTSYTYLNKIQAYEAIAIERELHGIPVGRIPAEYLATDAGVDQQTLKNSFIRALRDMKNNEQGFVLLPSDVYMDADGKPTTTRLIDVELMTANGSRSIDIDPVVRRYQHDIARSLMAEFLLLGSQGGSYALSKTKTDLFLRSLESYINAIVDTLNKQLVEPLWQINALDPALMPKLCAGDVAPADLKEISSFLRNINGAGIPVKQQVETVADLFEMADLDFSEDDYSTALEQDNKMAEMALTQPKAKPTKGVPPSG
jgi:phage gp29-like protein